MRINLQVPRQDREQARMEGAQWDEARRRWYVEDAENLEPFFQWIPGRLKRPLDRERR